jgi:Ca2+-binding RTX toxin-like protein
MMSDLVFSVSPSATLITEGSSITFTVSLSSPFSAVERVNYLLTFSSATQSDFIDSQLYSGTLSFDPNQTVKTITFSTLDDALKEVSEQFTFSLINVEEWTSISETAGSASISLIDNDTPPVTYFNNNFGTYAGTISSDNIAVTSSFNSIKTGRGDDIISLDTFTSTIDGGDGNDEITTSDTVTHSTIIGGNGDDTLNLTISHSRITGDDGNDSIIVDAGHSTISGGLGNDLIIVEGNFLSLAGDSGNDIMRPTAISFATIDGGAGSDTIDLSQFDNMGRDINIDLNIGSQTLGNFGFNTITNFENVIGTNAADTISGNSSSNNLNGGAGNDTIRSGSGGDLISGGEGNDQVDGQGGTDTLTGGLGNDVFVFSSAKDLSKALANADSITDFTRGDDKIYLTFDSNSRVKGVQTSFKFIGSQAFSKNAGELRYTPTLIDKDGTSYIYLQGDTNGDGSFDFIIKLSGVTSLDKTDFISGTVT